MAILSGQRIFLYFQISSHPNNQHPKVQNETFLLLYLLLNQNIITATAKNQLGTGQAKTFHLILRTMKKGRNERRWIELRGNLIFNLNSIIEFISRTMSCINIQKKQKIEKFETENCWSDEKDPQDINFCYIENWN